MKKILIILVFLLSMTSFAQFSDWDNDYYGSNKTRSSQSLIILDGDSVSGAYWVINQISIIKVDSNWTDSNIGFMVYNNLEGTWEALRDEAGDIIEYFIDTGEPVVLSPTQSVGLKYIKFFKVTSGSDVEQSGADAKLEVETVRFN